MQLHQHYIRKISTFDLKLSKLKVYMTGKINSTVRPNLPKIFLMRRYGIATLIKFLFLADKVVRIEFYVADCVETEARM